MSTHIYDLTSAKFCVARFPLSSRLDAAYSQNDNFKTKPNL